jgi:hypothetical protein
LPAERTGLQFISSLGTTGEFTAQMNIRPAGLGGAYRTNGAVAVSDAQLRLSVLVLFGRRRGDRLAAAAGAAGLGIRF